MNTSRTYDPNALSIDLNHIITFAELSIEDSESDGEMTVVDELALSAARYLKRYTDLYNDSIVATLAP